MKLKFRIYFRYRSTYFMPLDNFTYWYLIQHPLITRHSYFGLFSLNTEIDFNTT